MNALASPAFASAGVLLDGAPGLALQWSLRIDRGGATVRDRVIAWISPENRAGRASAFRPIGALLAKLGAPLSVRQDQWRLAGASTSQGIAMSLDGSDSELCLYIAVDSPGGTRYLCYRWREEGLVEHARYSCHALPATPNGVVPAACVHPSLQAACALATMGEALRRQAPFWLRRRDGLVDRISLEYRWQPPLARVATLLGAAFPALLTDPVFARYRHHHFRHLAFSGTTTPAPFATVAFCAPWRAPWPTGAAQLHEGVRHAAGAQFRRIESRTAAVAATPPRDLECNLS